MVKTIVILGSKNDRLVGLDILKKKNLVLITESDVSRLIREQNPFVKKIAIERVLPDLIVITPEYYAPFAYLNASGGYLIVAHDATILQKARIAPMDLVGISYYQKLNFDDYQSGQVVDFNEIKKSLEALKIARDLGLPVLTVAIEGSNMIRLQLEDKTILFSAHKTVQLQGYQLEKLVRQFALEGKNYKSIDIRFEKPVVRFAK